MRKLWPISWRGIEIIAKYGQKDLVGKLLIVSCREKDKVREAQALPVAEDVPPSGLSLGVMTGWGRDRHRARTCL